MRKVGIFLALVWAEWASRVTGAFSAVLVLLGLGLGVAGALGIKIPAESIIQVGTWILAAVCGGYAAFSVWSRERIAKENLEARLTPKFTAIFDPKRDPCRSVSEFRFAGGRSSRNGMVYRIEVENIGADIVNECEGYLTELTFEGETPKLGVFNLWWAGKYPQDLKVDLKPKVPRHLDLLVIYEPSDVAILSPGWPPNNQQMFFARRGCYLLTVVVSANQSTLRPYKLRLNYTGDWQTSTMKVLLS